MHIGLVTLEVPGHLNPLTSLGAELVERGHSVSLIGGRPARSAADRAGLGFIPIGIDGDRDLELDRGRVELGRMTGFAAMRQTGRLMAGYSRIILADLPKVLKEQAIDGLIADQFTPAAVLTAEREKTPVVIACNALAAHLDRYSPPCAMLWRYRPTLWGRIRNALARRLVPPLYNWFADSKAVGVRPLQLLSEWNHGYAEIAQQPDFFDFPRDLPEHFHYTAPWHRKGRDADIPFPWERLDGRPLVYASMGTLQNNLPAVFNAIGSAVRTMPIQLVLSLGGRDDAPTLNLPDNVILVQKAPQLALLDRCAAVITHAGLNTALECLAHGVPMLCIPVTNDQPGVAMRVEYLGAGAVVPLKKATAPRIRRGLEHVLHDPEIRRRCDDYRRKLADRRGCTEAAEIVERALSTKHVVRRIASRADAAPSTPH